MIIGILGCGTIANIIINNYGSDLSHVNINYFFDKEISKAKSLAKLTGGVAISNFDDMLEKADIILETASPDSVKIFAPKILSKGKDIIIMSVGALMDKNLKDSLESLAKKNNAKIYLPSGAISGLDGVKAGFMGDIYEVNLVTRKSPKSLGRKRVNEEILFEGKASEAVKLFPANINVAATVSIACNRDINVKIIADPKINRNIHELSVKGEFGEFKSEVINFQSKENPKTSMLAAFSIIKLLKSFNDVLVVGT